MLGVSGVAGQGLLDFFIDNDIDLYTSLGCSLQNLVNPPFLTEVWRATEEEFWREPPIFDVDSFFGALETYRDGPEVVTSIDVPLDLVVLTFWKERLVPMLIAHSGPLLVGLFLMLLVMAMVRIEEIPKLANLILQMNRLHLCIAQLAV